MKNVHRDEKIIFAMSTIFVVIVVLAFTSIFVRCGNQTKIDVPIISDTGKIQTSIDVELTKKVNDFYQQWYIKKVMDLYYESWKDKLTYYNSSLNKVKITEQQYPWLYQMVKAASVGIGIEMPDTFVVFSDSPNAYIAGVNQPILVIHSHLIELLNPKTQPEELLFIIGQQLARIKFQHLLARDVVETTYYALEFIPTELLRGAITNLALLSFLKWSREAIISADRVGMILVNSEEIASQTLIKLTSGLGEEFKINIEDFLSNCQTKEFDLVQTIVLLKELNSAHPFICNRVEALRQYKNSPEFAEIISSFKDNQRIYLQFR